MAATEAPAREPSSESRRAGGAAVELRSLSHFYARRGEERLEVLGDLSLSVAPGEVVGVVGPSGCGKSTLLEVVAGLREPTGGGVAVGGAFAAGERLRRCAFMPQHDLLMPWRSALDNAALALQLQGASRREARRGARPLFERFGLADFERAGPGELSGGMRQRVAFARTLLAGKPVLLLDEPLAGLDAITRADLQAWLAGALAEDRRTVLLVTHDTEEALYLCDRVLVLSARPARLVRELALPQSRAERLERPRRETVTDAEFARQRELALEALE